MLDDDDPAISIVTGWVKDMLLRRNFSEKFRVDSVRPQFGNDRDALRAEELGIERGYEDITLEERFRFKYFVKLTEDIPLTRRLDQTLVVSSPFFSKVFEKFFWYLAIGRNNASHAKLKPTACIKF